MSTSDTVLLFANGASGVDANGSDAFGQAVHDVMTDLAYAVVADGEGATRVIRVRVTGAASELDACESRARSRRPRCSRPRSTATTRTWGAIVQALGQADAKVDPDSLVVSMCGIELSRGGVETGRRAKAAVAMRGAGEVLVQVDLGLGTSSFEFLGCDLTPEYVTFNAEYTT